MYRLMIVEDEPIEREALKMMIRANCEDISEIEEADNGFEAIKKCRIQPPDIMIVDLNMPGISGLETIREIQKISGKIRVLILSAYNQFEFAQEAIKLGVEDYMVKPAKIADIRKAIQNITERMNLATAQNQENTALLTRMEDIRPVLTRDCLYAIVYAKEGTGLGQMLDFLGLRVAGGFCFGITYEKGPRMILNLVKRSFEEMGILCIGEQFHNLLVFFLLDEKAVEERRREEVGRFVQMLLKEHGYLGSRIGVGRIYERYEEFFQSYREVLSVLKGDKEVGEDFQLYEREVVRKVGGGVEFEKLCRHLVLTLRSEDDRQLKECVGWLTAQLLPEENSIKRMGELFNQVITMTFLRVQNFYQDIELPDNLFVEQMLRAENLREMENYCYIQLRSLQQAIAKYGALDHNLIIHRALKCINGQYAGDVSLNSVAKELGISVFYLSKIIKKNTGKNFTDILAQKRMTEAKRLLLEQRSIKEVTYMVGFNSQNYFAKVFKKYIGCAPREYRRRGND